MKDFKTSLNSIQLPESAKASVKAAIDSESQKNPVRGTRIRRERFMYAVAAAVLIFALTVSLVPAMLINGGHGPITSPDENIYPSVNFNGNWVDSIFGNESITNSSGIHVGDYTADGDIGDSYKDFAYEDSPTGDSPIFSPEDPDIAYEYVDSTEEFKPSTGIFNENISAGTLSAGRIEDNLDFASFCKAVSDLGISYRGLFPSKRITVRVPGVSSAKVALADSQGNILATAVTDINGNAYLYYSLKSENAGEPYRIGVSKNGSFADITVDGKDDVTVELDAQSESVKLDIMIMLDTTGSMGDELEYIKVELKDMINRIANEGQTVDIRASVNFYRDHGDEYVVKYYEFTDDIDRCVGYLGEQYATGGGDFPEAVDEALVNGVTEHAWRDDAVKIMFMVLDAPAHTESERQGVNANIYRALTKATELGIRIVPIVASGADNDLEATMRTAAAVTGGVYLYLTDHSGIGDSHKEPENSQSDIYPLNDLMVDTVLRYIKPNFVSELSKYDTRFDGIKEKYAKFISDKYNLPQSEAPSADDISYVCFGVYSDCPVFKFYGDGLNYTQALRVVEVAGYRITLPDGQPVYVYANDSFLLIKEAYEAGSITADDVYKLGQALDSNFADNNQLS